MSFYRFELWMIISCLFALLLGYDVAPAVVIVVGVVVGVVVVVVVVVVFTTSGIDGGHKVYVTLSEF